MIASAAVSPPVLRTADGDVIPLFLDRWQASPPLEEVAVLARAVGPVLDVGCGPGRHTQALAERGTVALGIDTSPSAVDAARRRGCAVLHRSVFDPLPREGRWRSAFLIDGNIGIGGDAPRCYDGSGRSWPVTAGCSPRSSRLASPPSSPALGSSTGTTAGRGSRGLGWAQTASTPSLAPRRCERPGPTRRRADGSSS